MTIDEAKSRIERAKPQQLPRIVMDREWTQEEIDADMGEPLICPLTGQPCITEQDEFCEDYGCARKAGIDVDRMEVVNVGDELHQILAEALAAVSQGK